jgi:ATP-dependent helicase/nuclease subunit B
MITPRRTRLVRVPDLQAFRAAIVQLADPESRVPNPDTLIVVPTRSAAAQLARSLPAAVCVTRDELYAALHARLADAPRRLTAIERDVLAQAAARAVVSAGEELSFQVRPGLVAELLRFYDQLRRQGQQVARFEELILDTLGPAETDTGADRMRRQTLFLADTFREYERRVRNRGALDEHLLRERLIADIAPNPVRRIIVTVADWIADVDGLYVADFGLLSRLSGLETIDLVATEGVLGSGFDERLHEWWPGLEEIRMPAASSKPMLLTPPNAPPDQLWWTLRDREEELAAVARTTSESVAVVFKRPLPYLYVAPRIFADAGLAVQTSAALPLAAEPTAAALDLVLEAVATRFTRGSLVALLRSPHFAFTDGSAFADATADKGGAVTRVAVSALDRALSEARYLGDPETLASIASEWREHSSPVRLRSVPALEAAVTVTQELAPLGERRRASEQLGTLVAFWCAHLRPLADDESGAGLHGAPAARFLRGGAETCGRSAEALRPFALVERERRARAAIGDLLSALAAAHAAEDDPEWTIDDLAIAVRRAIEDHTFAADSAASGVHLLDDQAVRYGTFDHVAIVGLVESDWPEPPRRNIFYPSGLLKALGWPTEKDRRAAEDARFLDLLGCATLQTRVSTFTLEDDALVTRSVQLDEMPRARLSSIAESSATADRVFVEEALATDTPALAVVDGDAREWLDVRLARTPATSPNFHGSVGAATRSGAFTISALETYLDCPFKFFAQRVLRLEEEPDDEEVMDPRRQGQLMHEVFEQFFREWQDAGHRGVTRENLDAARDLFTAVVDRALEDLPPAEAGLERTRLLGSPAAAGLGEAVLRMEAERPVPVVGRLLEHDLRGEFTFTTADGERTIALAGKVDRIDLLDDGTFRLIDYKLGWPPDRRRALQLPIYALCAEQRLGTHRGRPWMLGEAVYLAFKGPRRVVPLFSTDRSKVLEEAQQRLADTVDAIGRGEFPPRPDDVYRCETCRFAAVCRKDYVGDV